MTGHDNPKIVALLENQIQDLKAQLEKADAQTGNHDGREIQAPRSAICGERGKACFDATTRRKEPRIKRKPAAPADR